MNWVLILLKVLSGIWYPWYFKRWSQPWDLIKVETIFFLSVNVNFMYALSMRTLVNHETKIQSGDLPESLTHIIWWYQQYCYSVYIILSLYTVRCYAKGRRRINHEIQSKWRPSPESLILYNIVLTFYQRSNGQLWDSNVKLTWFYVQCCRSFNVVVMCILQKGIKKETWSKWRPSSTQIKQNKVMYCCSNIYSYDLERTYLLLTICIDSQE